MFEEVKADLRSIHSFWHGITREDEVNAHVTQEILDAREQGLIHRGGISNSGDGHIIPNHEVFSHGYRGLINEMKLRLLDKSLTDHQRLFYECSIICLEGALDYIKRYRPILKEMAEQSDGPERRRELEQMAELSLTLLEGPVTTFYEGVMAACVTHVLQMVESNGHSFCYGRFDQYMNALYSVDLEAGRITQESALELLTHFFIMNSSQNKVRAIGHTKFSQGYRLYSNLMVGGYRPDGRNGTNPCPTFASRR